MISSLIATGPLHEDVAREIFARLMRTIAELHNRRRVAYGLTCSTAFADGSISDSAICSAEDYGISCSRSWPAYASPESLIGDYSDYGSDDVWAAGVIFYRILVGAYPFYADHQTELTQMVLLGRFVEPPASIEACIMVHSLLRRRRPSADRVLRSRYFNIPNTSL